MLRRGPFIRDDTPSLTTCVRGGASAEVGRQKHTSGAIRTCRRPPNLRLTQKRWFEIVVFKDVLSDNPRILAGVGDPIWSTKVCRGGRHEFVVFVDHMTCKQKCTSEAIVGPTTYIIVSSVIVTKR